MPLRASEVRLGRFSLLILRIVVALLHIQADTGPRRTVIGFAGTRVMPQCPASPP